MWKSSRWVGLIFSVLTLSGCAIATQPSTAMPVSPTITRTLLPTTTLTEFPSPLHTTQPMETATYTPTPTITSIPLTPLPTLHFNESALKVMNLLANNGGCRLPCFWGITPGKTTSAELYHFLNQFSDEVSAVAKDQDHYTFYYAHPESGDTTFTVEFFEEETIIKGIGIKLDTARLSFPLTKLLSNYGKPDRVLIGLNHSDYEMFVLFGEQRIVGQYHLWYEYDGNYLCYDPTMVIGIVTWAEDKYWLDYVNQLFGIFTDKVSEASLKSLDQVTEYDLDSFYKQFSTNNRRICMKMLSVNPKYKND